MPGWRDIVAQVASNVEDHFDSLKQRLDLQLGRESLQLLTYRGYGTPERLWLKGRVLENNRVSPAEDNDTIWDNLLNMYRRFATDEIAGARVLLRFGDREQEFVTGEEGFFEAWLEPAPPLPPGPAWFPVEVELLEPSAPGQGPVRATGQVLVPPPGARYGVISDIDDTVVHTGATNLLLMARTVFLGNARTRLPFPGVAAFYRALQAGASGHAQNPLFYVSSSAWNIYDLLGDFFRLRDIPAGPILLRDWGLSERELLPTGHRHYKLGVIRQIVDTYPDLPFILIGDSGQEDPEIYHELVSLYKGRILAVFIRNVSREPKRAEAIQALAKEVVAAGSTLILAENTLPLAEYAAEQGWIAPAALAEIETEKEQDGAPPGPLEEMLSAEASGGEEAGPTVVVETDAAAAPEQVDQALQAGDPDKEKPPTVVIKSDETEK